MRIKPSFGPKTKIYPDINITVIYAKEVQKTGGSREPIDWKLITNLGIKDVKDAIEKLNWYALRWKIEVFFKILKSGCKVEESKLRTADGLCKLISIYSVLSWRVFWMTMLNRESQDLSVKFAPRAKPRRSRYIARAIIEQVKVRDQNQCKYRHPQTGERCTARHFLQIEHIRPFAKGGSHDVENLELLCPAHNRFRAIEQFGSKRIQRFLVHR